MRRPYTRPWMLVSALWLAPALLATADTIAQRRLHGEPPPNAVELLFSFGDWLIYALLTPPIFWIANRWPIVRPRVSSRILLHLGISLLFCAAWALGGTALRLTLGWLLDPQGVSRFVHEAGDRLWQRIGTDAVSWIFTTLPFGVIVYLFVAGIAHAVRYFMEATEREVQMARLSQQLAGARLAALQAQLNPHFLFNTLNTIAVRARDGDRTGTVRIVEQLSDVLRRTLARHRADEVTLREELDLVRQYLAIEQARFPDTLQPTFSVDEALAHAAVPGFSVQHLVENALRHGISKRPGAGRLTVTAARTDEDLIVTVTDDGVGIDEADVSKAGHGIDSTRERLQVLYGNRASLHVTRADTGGTVAVLRVPFHNVVMESGIADS